MRDPRAQRAGKATALVLLAALAGTGPAEAAECPEWPDDPDRGATRYAVVVDATEGFSRAQKRSLAREVGALAANAPPKSVFHIWQVHGQWEDGYRRLASVCRPPRSDEVNNWLDNLNQRRVRWEPRFLRPLEAALARAANAEPSETSAILQAIQAAAADFRGTGGESPDQGRLVLVSDLMQHQGDSFYEAVPTLSDFRRTPLYRGVKAKALRGAQLTVLRLPLRDPGVSEAALLRFWTGYFRDQGMRGDPEGCADAAAKNLRCAFGEIEGLPVWAVPEG